MYRATHVEINLHNIKNNIKTILEKYNDYKYYFGVVKGNCYGHGFETINTLIENGINYLAVSSLDEAMKIREINKDIPILCLQPIDTSFLDICSKNKITLTVHSLHYAEEIKDIKEPISIHIKIDSGMSRLGFDDKQDLKNAINTLGHNKNINIEGIFTHMGTTGIADIYRKKQLEAFADITNLIDLNMFKIIHIDRSITMLCQEKIPFCNGIRVGIAMYGYGQKKIERTFIDKIKYSLKRKIYNIPERNYDEINLTPAFSIYTKIIQVKKIKAGQLVGYGMTYKADNDMFVATAEIGYYDGLNLNYNNNYVYIKNKRYKIIGTINMGMISIAIDNTIKEGDTVELFGNNITAKDAARNANTTVYQLLTCIPEFIPRMYIKERKED